MIKNTPKLNKHNIKVIVISLSIGAILVTVITVILVSFFTNGKNKYKDDNVIELWTTNQPRDIFYNDFQSEFIDEFNSTYGEENDITVKMISVSPETSMGQDIGIKMMANDKVPNLFIGIPEDSISLLDSEKSTYIYDLNDITDSDVMDSVSKVYDDQQDKYIKPYFPMMQSGEVLYINNEHMWQIISFLEENNILNFSKEFKDQFFEEEIEFNLDMSTDNINNESLTFIKDNFLSGGEVEMSIFDSYDGIFALESLMNSIITNDDIDTFAFDYDLNSTYYLTFNEVKNNYDDWMFNSTNDRNFITCKKVQNAYQLFLDTTLKYKDTMWFRKSITAFPPFSNSLLSMFVGKDFNSKYMNSSIPEEIQFDEVSILRPPTKIRKNQRKNFSYLSTKTLVPIKFTMDERSKEDIATKAFINFVNNKLFSNYDFFIKEGYLPPKTNEESFTKFNDYIQNIDLDKEEPKQKSLDKALQGTSEIAEETFINDSFDSFFIPQVKTTKLFDTIIQEANHSYWESDGEFDAIGYVINQLKILGNK